MEFDLTDFSTAQQQAFLDLLILAMYADGNLSAVEDERLQKLLKAMGHVDEIDRQREFDAAVTRTRPFVESIQRAKDQTLLLIKAFTTRRQHQQVFTAVEGFMTSDGHVSSWEDALLSELRLKLKV